MTHQRTSKFIPTGFFITHELALVHITNILNLPNTTYQEKKNLLADFIVEIQCPTPPYVSKNDESDFNFD